MYALIALASSITVFAALVGKPYQQSWYKRWDLTRNATR